MTGMPTWLRDDLIVRGLIHPDGATRSAVIQRCPKCRALVLRGLDADLAALLVICDATEIDTRGELVALALGLRTYMLTRSTNSSGKTGWNIDPRLPAAILAGQRTALVATHRCGIAIPPAATTRIPTWLGRRHAPLPDHPPF